MNMNTILDTLAKGLSEQPELKLVSIYFDEAELSPNNISFPCIQFQPMAWRRVNRCTYERELQIRIIVNTRTKRDAIVELYNYEEIVRDAIDNLDFDFELNLIGGSQIAILQYINKDPDSYKSTKTLYGSAIAIRYLLRYETEDWFFMKFKYVGQAGFKDLDLCIAGITNPNDVLIPDTIIEIPDTNTALIQRVKLNGNYQEIQERPTVKKVKKVKENKKDKGEDK